MKQFRLTVAVLLSVWGLAGVEGAKADDRSGANGVKIEKSENKKVRIYTPAGGTQTGAPVDVAVIDADGNVLYKGVLAQNKTGRQSFNFNNLPDGQYYITAGNNAWWMSQGVTVAGNTVNVDERNLQQITQPTITAYEKNKIELTVPATNVKDANIAIYDAQNVLVHSEKLSVSTRRFDLSSLPEGAYTFVVGPEQKTFTSRFNVRR